MIPLLVCLLSPPALLEPPSAEAHAGTTSIESPVEAEPPAPQLDIQQLEAAIRALPPAPSLARVQAAALERARVDIGLAARWLRRARLAALAPTLSLQYDHRLDRGWTLDQAAGEADALRDDAGEQGQLRAKLSWELDRLIFNPDELRAARALIDLAELRERLLVEVTRLYFERQRLLLEARLEPPQTIEDALSAALRVREIEGLLEGLSGLSLGPEGPHVSPALTP